MEHKNLAAALAAAQSEMEHAALDGYSDYYKSKYSTLTAVINAVKPLAKHGIAFIQHSRPADKGVGIETVFYGYGEAIGCGVVFVPFSKADAHGVGSAITYAKRYSLAMACGIAADEDDDGNAVVSPPKKKAQSVANTVIEQEGLKTTPQEQKKLKQHGEAIMALTDDSELLEAYLELLDDDKDYLVKLWAYIPAPVRQKMRKLLHEHEEAKQAVAAG